MKFKSELLVLVLTAAVVGCAGPKSRGPQETPDETTEAPHTGDSAIEQQQPEGEAIPPQVAGGKKSEVQPGNLVERTPEITGSTVADQEYFVFPDRLRLRATPFIVQGNILAILETNDKVAVRDSNVYEAEGFVKVEVLSERQGLTKGTIGFVPLKYLTEKPKDITVEQKEARTFFVIQNIATEILRVYEKCQSTEPCSHRLVLQTKMVAGEDKDRYQTALGYFKINNWHKFYEDGARHYPAWYRPNYPDVPSPTDGLKAWIKDKVMPKDAPEAKSRGAFGWFTATVGPNSYAQWTHGTVGWAESSKKAIRMKETFGGKLLDIFTKIRSSGCSRVDNPTIAYLQYLLPVGTPIIKIYAKEAILDPVAAKDLASSKEDFDWILTKRNYGKTGVHPIQAADVMSSGVSQSEIIEEGRYSLNKNVTVEKGDLYDIGSKGFAGLFYVDAGLVKGYSHPAGLKRGGFSDQKYPAYLELGTVTK